MSERVRQTDFHHEAFFYADADEFLAGAVPFLRDGLEAGERALVAVGRARAEALRAELDGDGEQISFVDMEQLGRNPACIIPAWRRFVDEHGGTDRPIRGIGEPIWVGRSAAEIDECQRHESLLNYAFWDGPPWRLLCPYDSSGLDDDVLEAAHCSHAFVSGSAAGREEGVEMALDPEAVAPFAGNLPPTANSVIHGGGDGALSVWLDDGALAVEVEDRGTIEGPLTGRLRPSARQHGGRGLWMVNHLCDLAQVRSDKNGTRVRVRMGTA